MNDLYKLHSNKMPLWVLFYSSTARRYYDIHVGRVANIKRGYKTDIYENKKYDILLILLLRRRNCSKMKLNKILILKALRLKIKQKNKTYCAEWAKHNRYDRYKTCIFWNLITFRYLRPGKSHLHIQTYFYENYIENNLYIKYSNDFIPKM